MEFKERSINCQIFICTHNREDKESCAGKNSLDLFKNLKTKSKEDPTWKGKIKVAQSSCLGLCSEGIAAVIYPQNKCIIKLNTGDVKKVISLIESSQVLREP